jgi:small GTP-binding protein
MGCGDSVLEPPSVFTDRKGFSLPRASKIVLLGNTAVGKSSIALRFCQGRFPQSHEVTIGSAFLQQTVRTSNGGHLKMHIWDTGGQERFRAMAPIYYRDASAALVVFDCTEAASFSAVSFWINELSNKGPMDIKLVVVANKCETTNGDWAVPRDEAINFCRIRGLDFFEVSALTGHGVEELFKAVADHISIKER